MTNISMIDIEKNETMSSAAMTETKGGWFYYYNVFNRYQNPFG